MYKTPFIFLLALNFVSCSLLETKEDVISELEVLVDSLDPTHSDLTPELIEVFDAEFLDLTENRIPVYKSDMTPEERKIINDLVGRYQARKLQFFAKETKERIQDALQQGAAMTKELLPDSLNIKEALEQTEALIKELQE